MEGIIRDVLRPPLFPKLLHSTKQSVYPRIRVVHAYKNYREELRLSTLA